ncbi:MAG: transmembrane anchor protein [Desulfobacterales bacterium]|nr:transmembrane anchor protein [Desulfobacterales bacterium]
MYNSNIPTDRALPSTQKLIKSTLSAAVIAAILLITTVLPGEYGIDPTGIGQAIGLKKMGEIKVSLAKEAAADKAKAVQTLDPEPTLQDQEKEVEQITEKAPLSRSENPMRQETIRVTLVPNQGIEVKTKMSRGQTLTYKWSTDGGRANFDVHGDSKELKIDYFNYEKGSEQTKEGTITAAFDGSHGWFWRNRTSKTLTVDLQVSGEFSKLQRMN